MAFDIASGTPDGTAATVERFQRCETKALEPPAPTIRDLAAAVGAIVIAYGVEDPLTEKALVALRPSQVKGS